MEQIICKDLSLGYEGSIVVSDLSFSVSKGDYLAIVGENGSGKTTTMKSILGLLKPLSGEILIDGSVKGGKLGYLPQQTQIQKDFPASVLEVVMSGFVASMGIRPFYNKDEKQRALENIKLMGLDKMAKRSYKELSGGQQQRVLLARALCATKDILLLDEPTVGLDPKATAEMYKLIEELNKSGITIIMITHDIIAGTKYANKILHIGFDGKKHFFGPKEKYLEQNIFHFGGEA